MGPSRHSQPLERRERVTCGHLPATTPRSGRASSLKLRTTAAHRPVRPSRLPARHLRTCRQFRRRVRARTSLSNTRIELSPRPHRAPLVKPQPDPSKAGPGTSGSNRLGALMFRQGPKHSGASCSSLEHLRRDLHNPCGEDRPVRFGHEGCPTDPCSAPSPADDGLSIRSLPPRWQSGRSATELDRRSG